MSEETPKKELTWEEFQLMMTEVKKERIELTALLGPLQDKIGKVYSALHGVERKLSELSLARLKADYPCSEITRREPPKTIGLDF